MIPIPTSRIFRSRGAALKWSFWVIVGAVLTIGFGNGPATDSKAAAHATDATGATADDQAVKDLLKAMNAS